MLIGGTSLHIYEKDIVPEEATALCNTEKLQNKNQNLLRGLLINLEKILAGA